MKVEVNQEKCLKCGMCVGNFNDIFEWDDNGNIKVKDNIDVEEVKQKKDEILEICPAGAIEISEN